MKHIDWRPLYLVGGLAPFVALVFYGIEMGTIVTGEPFPADMAQWYDLFARGPLKAMIYLNALDILSIAGLAVMFLALGVALHPRREAWMAMMVLVAVIGAAVYVTPRTGSLSLLDLSEQYAAAPDEDTRQRVLAAGETVGVQVRATPQMPGFLFLALAGLAASVAMADGRVFGKVGAYAGILGNGVILLDQVSLVLFPAAADILMGLSGLPLVLWWVLTGARLLRMSRFDVAAEAG